MTENITKFWHFQNFDKFIFYLMLSDLRGNFLRINNETEMFTKLKDI
jgi:hypothetical protein